MMNNLPRQTLVQILTKYGKDVCSDARRCESLLNDLCGAHRREINVLVNAVEERIPLDLLAGASSMSSDLLLTRLEKRLEDQTALTAEAARWAVESWALALDIISESEIERRQKSKLSARPVTKTEADSPAPPFDSKRHDAEASNPSPAPSPRLPKSPASGSIPRHPPLASAPGFPAKTPPFSPVNNPPAANNRTPVQTPTNNTPASPAVVSRSRFGILRGCLILVFLLAAASVVLLFGVPYAIEVMRETQREKNNEPPRFPVR